MMGPERVQPKVTPVYSYFSFYRSAMSDRDLVSMDYEIFGRVQGVFFRKYTQVSLKVLEMSIVVLIHSSHIFAINVV